MLSFFILLNLFEVNAPCFFLLGLHSLLYIIFFLRASVNAPCNLMVHCRSSPLILTFYPLIKALLLWVPRNLVVIRQVGTKGFKWSLSYLPNLQFDWFRFAFVFRNSTTTLIRKFDGLGSVNSIFHSQFKFNEFDVLISFEWLELDEWAPSIGETHQRML